MMERWSAAGGLILSSIPPVAGPLIQHCIILYEPEARTPYSTIPAFQHSNGGEATKFDTFAAVSHSVL